MPVGDGVSWRRSHDRTGLVDGDTLVTTDKSWPAQLPRSGRQSCTGPSASASRRVDGDEHGMTQWRV